MEQEHFNTHVALRCAMFGEPILRALMRDGQTMTYGKFAQEIGLLGDGGWRWKHIEQVGQILDIIAASARYLGEPVEHWRVVNAETGVAGSGAGRVMSIVDGRAA
jgi:alkylated DNA nucleotide flippase Atl1